MSEIDKAIKLLYTIKPSCKKCIYTPVFGECNPDCTNPENERLIQLAIDALRAQAARENTETETIWDALDRFACEGCTHSEKHWSKDPCYGCIRSNKAIAHLTDAYEPKEEINNAQ